MLSRIANIFSFWESTSNGAPKSNLGGQFDLNSVTVIPPEQPRVRTYADRTFGPVALQWSLDKSGEPTYKTKLGSANEAVKKIRNSKSNGSEGELDSDLKTRIGGCSARSRPTFVALLDKLEHDLKDLDNRLSSAAQQDLTEPLIVEIMHARQQVLTTLSTLASDIAQHRQIRNIIAPLISGLSVVVGFGLNIAANVTPTTWLAWLRLFPPLSVEIPIIYALRQVCTDMEDGGIHQLEKSVDEAFKALFEAPIVADALRLHVLERALEAVVKSRDYEDSVKNNGQASSGNDNENRRAKAAKQAVNSVLTELKLDKVFLASEVDVLADKVKALLSKQICVFADVERALTAKVEQHYSNETEQTKKLLISQKMRKFKQTLEDARLSRPPTASGNEGIKRSWKAPENLDEEASKLIELYLRYRAELKLATEARKARKSEKARNVEKAQEPDMSIPVTKPGPGLDQPSFSSTDHFHTSEQARTGQQEESK